jgi:hypothetical protein
MIDFACIPKQYVDFIEPKQQAAYQAYIDDINQHGGIAGRQIKPFYKTVCPVNFSGMLSTCTELTDDDNVFAVIGDFGDITNDAQLCVAKTHKRILLTYGLTQEVVDKAPAGHLLTPDILPDRRVKLITALLKAHDTLKGKTVAVLGESDTSAEVNKQIEPGLRSIGVARGSTGIVTTTGADTTAALGQLDSFIERWKTEHVDTVFLAGGEVESVPFVQKLRAAFPNVTLIADSTGVETSGQQEVKAHTTPNPYDGIITAEGRTGVEHAQTQHYTTCTKIFETATHITVPPANVVVKGPGGVQDNIQGEAGDACVFVEMFKTIAERVGRDLNNANWTTAVDNFGKIDIVSTDFASLHKGKYDADNTYGLVAFDPTLGDAGDWRHLTPTEDVGNLTP